MLYFTGSVNAGRDTPERNGAFVWGAATAAYQIEGAVSEDGRGESIWDRFCAIPGNVRNGESGSVACDFYHRYREDVALMAELGLEAFRFSVAWPRVLPKGRGRVNRAGLDFYDRLVDELLEHGIEPCPTLYHWDLPVALEDGGGWPARATAEAFAEYAGIVADSLGDRVALWTTHNEPHVAAWDGYGYGVHAPGRKSVEDALAAAHHLLLSHGLAAEAIRAAAPAARVGITLNLWPMEARSDSAEDLAAAREADGHQNRWFLDPVFRGEYPADMLEAFAPHAPPVRPGDLETIAAPVDFLGVNYYHREVVAADGSGRWTVVHQDGSQYTDMGWEVSPHGLRDVLERIWEDYAPPAIYVTENGAAFGDTRAHDGGVHDPERLAYLAAHVKAVRNAAEAGVPVRGYFVWSLFDNFEWAQGYFRRFGLVYVDYPTLERIPKASFYWYRDLIAQTPVSPLAPAVG
jgi:beta-glucosidase